MFGLRSLPTATDDAQLLHRPWQVAGDEAASGEPDRFTFQQVRNINANSTRRFSRGWRAILLLRE
jgi:hypothetical protein